MSTKKLSTRHQSLQLKKPTSVRQRIQNTTDPSSGCRFVLKDPNPKSCNWLSYFVLCIKNHLKSRLKFQLDGDLKCPLSHYSWVHRKVMSRTRLEDLNGAWLYSRPKIPKIHQAWLMSAMQWKESSTWGILTTLTVLRDSSWLGQCSTDWWDVMIMGSGISGVGFHSLSIGQVK